MGNCLDSHTLIYASHLLCVSFIWLRIAKCFSSEYFDGKHAVQYPQYFIADYFLCKTFTIQAIKDVLILAINPLQCTPYLFSRYTKFITLLMQLRLNKSLSRNEHTFQVILVSRIVSSNFICVHNLKIE